MATPFSNVFPISSNPIYAGLLQGSAWGFSGARNLTYSLYNNEGFWTTGFTNTVQGAFQAWSNVANISFTQVSHTASQPYYQSTADIAVSWADLGRGLAGLAFFPDPNLLNALGAPRWAWPRPEGDVFITTRTFSISLHSLLMHEIGHALGLKHPHDDGGNGRPTYGALGLSSHDNSYYTIMSYNGGDTATPMPDDIAAIQALYGANMSYNTGNNTYVLQNNSIKASTIWDAGGFDVISAVNSSGGAYIDLRAGLYSWINSGDFLAIAYNCTIEGAVGSSSNDTLVGNESSNSLEGIQGRDVVYGNGGDDTLYGYDGGDYLDGGTGTNTVDYSRIPSSFVFGINVSLAGNIAALRGVSPDSLANIQHVVGTNGNDVLVGDGYGNRLDGGLGFDTIAGGGGANTISGGGGGDRVTYAGAYYGVAVSLAAGVATVNGFGSSDVLSGILHVTGSAFGDLLIGDSNVNGLTGGDGNDTLSGGAGSDFLDGGSGSNTADYGDEFAAVTVNLATGTGGNSFGTDTLINILNVSGSVLADALSGSSASNMLSGGAGNDTLTGGRGGDLLTGGSGANRFMFNAGDGHDVITDFKPGSGNDALVFTGTAPGNVLTASLRLQGLLTRSGGSLSVSTVVAGGPALSQSPSWWSQYVPNWTVVAHADFTGDGASDLMAQDPTTRSVYFWSIGLNGNMVNQGHLSWWSQYVPSWNIAGAADFTGLGRASLLGQSSDGTDTWLFTSTATGQLSTSVRLGWWQQYVPDWRIVSVADVSGDGRGDIVAQDPTSKALYAWSINGAGQITGTAAMSWWQQYLSNWQIAGVADVTGDGRADIIGQSGDRSETWVFATNASGALTSSMRLDWWAQYLSGWSILTNGDFTGDGRADIVARSGDQSSTWLFAMDSAGRLTESYDISHLAPAGHTVVGQANFTGLSTRVTTAGGNPNDAVDLVGVSQWSLTGVIGSGPNAQLNFAPLIQAMASFGADQSQLDGAAPSAADDPLASPNLLALPH